MFSPDYRKSKASLQVEPPQLPPLKTMTTLISSHLMMKSMKKPKESRLSVLPLMKHEKQQRKTRRVKLLPSQISFSISNHGKIVSDLPPWMDSYGVLVNWLLSDTVSKNSK